MPDILQCDTSLPSHIQVAEHLSEISGGCPLGRVTCRVNIRPQVGFPVHDVSHTLLPLGHINLMIRFEQGDIVDSTSTGTWNTQIIRNFVINKQNVVAVTMMYDVVISRMNI